MRKAVHSHLCNRDRETSQSVQHACCLPALSVIPDWLPIVVENQITPRDTSGLPSHEITVSIYNALLENRSIWRAWDAYNRSRHSTQR